MLLWRALRNRIYKTISGLLEDFHDLPLLHVLLKSSFTNRPFPSSLVPLFQNESKCETFHMKMSSACMRSFIFMQIKVIFIRMVSLFLFALKQRHKATHDCLLSRSIGNVSKPQRRHQTRDLMSRTIFLRVHFESW